MHRDQGKPGAAERPSRRALPVFYVLTIVAAVALFLLVKEIGSSLVAGGEPAPSPQTVPHLDTLMHFLLALAVIIITTRAMGAVFRRFHQPPVVGEVIGGIFLGPSILGRLVPDLPSYILPADTAPILSMVAQLGVILYMFLIGVELNLKSVRESGRAVLAISHVSIVFPFLLGVFLSLAAYERFAPPGVGFTSFALFMGVAMAITAFPVLARILSDRGLSRTRLGSIAITVAAVDDVTAWCLLAIVVSVAQADVSGALTTILLTALFLGVIFGVLRPLMKRVVPLLETKSRIPERSVAIVFAAVLISALTTEYIGTHAIFGAFLLGAIIPHDSRIAAEMTGRLETVVKVMLLPAFFAYTGMRADLWLVGDAGDWLFCGLIILVATVGKFGGTFIPAKLAGFSTRDSASLGILMNTRGLVELIVLNIGLDLGVISPRLFAMLVLMALVTTFATTPILDLLLRNHPWVPADSEPKS